MKVSSVFIKLNEEGKLPYAFATVTIDQAISVHGVAIRPRKDSETELVVLMPALKWRDGTYHECCHPVNTETRVIIEEAVLSAYKKVSECPEVSLINFESADEDPSLNLSEVQVRLSNNDDTPVRAYARVTLDGGFVLKGIKIVKRANSDELLLSMPARQSSTGRYMDIYHPVIDSVRKKLVGEVLTAYEEAHMKAV